MSTGIGLILRIGPGVPLTAPKAVIDALQSVEVTSKAVGTSGFKLVFRIDSGSLLQTLFLVAGGVSIPLVRIVVAVSVNGQIETLIDGVMTKQDVDTDSKSGDTTLTVTGEDLTRVMNYQEFSGLPFPAMPAEAQVALLLAKYALFGVVPKIIPSVMIDVPVATKQFRRQQGTDLEHIKDLAKSVGYVFYLEPGPPGTTFAYWGPRVKVGRPQHALAVDAGAATNVDDLTFTFNSDRAEMPIVMIQEPLSKLPIPIAVGSITPLSPPLGIVPPIPKKMPIIKAAAKWSPIRAALIAMATAARSAESVTVKGSLDVVRYGQVLKSRKLVGLRGAGLAFDGLYYVHSVTHTIKAGEYKQSFELTRNGLISTVPRIPA